MKILFIGLGSAGQRHLRNMIRILGHRAEYAAYRERKLKRVFDDNLNIISEMSVGEFYGIREFYDLDEGLAWKPDITVISNPNSMHMDYAVRAAYAGSDLFIEKPLAVSMEKVGVLEELVMQKGLKAYVGYQNRFHPCVKKMKEILESNRLGRIISVHCEIGELLTKMHGYEDYRGMAESQKATGGGVVLCQIHELDYLYWMFGLPAQLYAVGGRNSHLEIEVEDYAVTLCRYQKDGYEFPVMIHQDFLQSPPVRGCKIVGEYGRFEMNLRENEYELILGGETVDSKSFPSFERNDMFLEEMRAFLNCVDTREKEGIDLQDGCGSLRFALAIKESMEKKALVKC